MRQAPLIKELPFTERPQQRLQDVGPTALSTRELLACLLQTPNALSQAQELVGRFGLHGLFKASILELCQVPGIGLAKAVQLKAAFELGRRSTLDRQDDRFQITSPADVAHLLLHEMDPLDQEHLVVITAEDPFKIIERIGEVFVLVHYPAGSGKDYAFWRATLHIGSRSFVGEGTSPEYAIRECIQKYVLAFPKGHHHDT